MAAVPNHGVFAVGIGDFAVLAERSDGEDRRGWQGLTGAFEDLQRVAVDGVVGVEVVDAEAQCLRLDGEAEKVIRLHLFDDLQRSQERRVRKWHRRGGGGAGQGRAGGGHFDFEHGHEAHVPIGSGVGIGRGHAVGQRVDVGEGGVQAALHLSLGVAAGPVEHTLGVADLVRVGGADLKVDKH